MNFCLPKVTNIVTLETGLYVTLYQGGQLFRSGASSVLVSYLGLYTSNISADIILTNYK